MPICQSARYGLRRGALHQAGGEGHGNRRKAEETVPLRCDLRICGVVGPYCEPKRIQHPEVGLLELYGQALLDPDQFQTLAIFTTVPGTDSYDKLQLLSVIGTA